MYKWTYFERLVFCRICTPSSEVCILLEQPEHQNNFSFSLTRNFGYRFVRLVCLQKIIQQYPIARWKLGFYE